jgi:pimeloyl-ACP methyl ester carboxylesterase
LEPFLDDSPQLRGTRAHCANWILGRADSRDVEIQVVVLSDRSEDPLSGRDLLVYHPGGPSTSATRAVIENPSTFDLSHWAVLVWDGFTARDATGVCGPETLLYLTQRTPDDFAQQASGVTEECEGGYGSALELGAWAAAEELEDIRQRLGVESFDFFGRSYGTAIGEAYLEMHPDRVRRAVLDGPVGLEVPWFARLGAVGAVQRRLSNEMARACQTDHCGRTLEGVPYDESYSAIRAAILLEDRYVGGGNTILSPVMLDQATLMALRGEVYWQAWADAVDEALAGDGTLVWQIGIQKIDTLDWGNYYWSLCADIDRPRRPAAFPVADDPLLFTFASELAPCAGFPAGIARPAGSSTTQPEVLVVASENDVVTPAALLDEAPRLQEMAAICVTTLKSHTSYDDRDVRSTVDRFLRDGGAQAAAAACRAD